MESAATDACTGKICELCLSRGDSGGGCDTIRRRTGHVVVGDDGEGVVEAELVVGMTFSFVLYMCRYNRFGGDTAS